VGDKKGGQEFSDSNRKLTKFGETHFLYDQKIKIGYLTQHTFKKELSSLGTTRVTSIFFVLKKASHTSETDHIKDQKKRIRNKGHYGQRYVIVNTVFPTFSVLNGMCMPQMEQAFTSQPFNLVYSLYTESRNKRQVNLLMNDMKSTLLVAWRGERGCDGMSVSLSKT